MSSPAPPESPEAAASSPGTRALIVVVGAVIALTVALGLAALGGSWVRGHALVPADQPLPPAALTYADAPDAGRFFDGRDTVTVTVPWTMTAAEFLALYHLENNADARRALREQLAVRGDADRVERGARVSFHLTERAAR